MPGLLRRIFSKKTLRWIGIVVATLAALVLIFIAEENWRGRRAWDAYRAAAEKRGAKLFLKDFIPPDIPDAENYAAIPIIRDLFAERKDGEAAPITFPHPKGRRPNLPNDLKETRFNPSEWHQFFLEAKLPPGKLDNPANDLLRDLERYESVLQQIREASSRPHCKFPTRWEDGPAMPLPHLNFAMGTSLFLSLRTHAHLALGNSSAARAECDHAMRLYQALAAEPTLIAGLVRLSLLDRLESCVWDGLAAGQWADEDITALEKTFAEVRLFDDCRFAFTAERGFMNDNHMDFAKRGFDKLRDEMKAYEFIGMKFEPSLGERIFWHTFPKGWIFQIMVRSNEYFDWLLAPLDDSANKKDAPFSPPTRSSKDWLESHPAPPGVGKVWQYVMEQSLPVFDSAYKRYLYAHTRAQETRLACTLERFRRAKGGLPETLDELMPEFIEAIPKDVFDRKPLRYRRNADGGYDLWSIGSNRKDDGGKIDPKKTGEEQDDWLWHMPGRPTAP